MRDTGSCLHCFSACAFPFLNVTSGYPLDLKQKCYLKRGTAPLVAKITPSRRDAHDTGIYGRHSAWAVPANSSIGCNSSRGAVIMNLAFSWSRAVLNNIDTLELGYASSIGKHSCFNPIHEQCYQTRDLGARLGYFWLPLRLSKPYRYFATFVLLLTYLPRNVLEIGRLCEKLSISCQFRGILNFFNVNEQINHKLIGLRRHIEPSKSFESDYPQLPEVGQSIVFPPILVIFG